MESSPSFLWGRFGEEQLLQELTSSEECSGGTSISFLGRSPRLTMVLTSEIDLHPTPIPGGQSNPPSYTPMHPEREKANETLARMDLGLFMVFVLIWGGVRL